MFVPAVAAVTPVRPVKVPGAFVSPGRSTSKRLKGPAITETLLEVAAARFPLVNWILIFVAAAAARFVKVAMPLTAVMFVAPSNIPAPLLLTAVTISASLMRTLLKASSIKTTGCWTNGMPAVALAEGCVEMTSLLAAAAFTGVAGLLLAVLLVSETSEAVTV